MDTVKSRDLPLDHRNEKKRSNIIRVHRSSVKIDPHLNNPQIPHSLLHQSANQRTFININGNHHFRYHCKQETPEQGNDQYQNNIFNFNIPTRKNVRNKKKRKELTQEDIDEINDELRSRNYTLDEKTGEGGYATVFKMKSNHYNQLFALKVFYRDPNYSVSINKSYEIERSSLCNLDHPNIIKLYDYFSIDKFHFLVLEYCPNGSFEHIFQPFSGEVLRNLYRTILETVKYCHERNVAHCDIKPSNFLLDANGRLKLSDFGLSTKSERKSTMFGGSKPYMAPELYYRRPYDPKKSDVWSIAVTFFYLATKKMPWSLRNSSQMKVDIMSGKIRFPLSMDTEVGLLVSQMLVLNPENRPSIDSLLEHEFFTKVSPMIHPSSSQAIFSLVEQFSPLKTKLLLQNLSQSDNDKKEHIKSSKSALTRLPLLSNDRIIFKKRVANYPI